MKKVFNKLLLAGLLVVTSSVSIAGLNPAPSSNAGGAIATTILTSGSGTFTPTVVNGRAEITLVGGGGGGARPAAGCTRGASGGTGGNSIRINIVLTDASYSYSVGVAGTGAVANNTNGVAGGNTSFGSLAVFGGNPGTAAGVTAVPSTGSSIAQDTTSGRSSNGFTVVGGTSVASTSSGVGGAGYYAGYGDTPAAVAGIAASAGGSVFTTLGGGSAGSNSLMGIGGVGGNGAATTSTTPAAGSGYGAGGGGAGCAATTTGNGRDGTGGVIIIKELGL